VAFGCLVMSEMPGSGWTVDQRSFPNSVIRRHEHDRVGVRRRADGGRQRVLTPPQGWRPRMSRRASLQVMAVNTRSPPAINGLYGWSIHRIWRVVA
jgi:hypothetical protein